MKSIVWKKFSKLLVINELQRHVQKSGKKIRSFLCRCDCGNTRKVMMSNLTTWHSKSCWCVTTYRWWNSWSWWRKTHWMTWKRIYRIRKWMKNRCYNEKQKDYKYYWLRWIKMCDEWQSFESFYDDMISWYKDHLQIDRIDNDWDYEPWNCRRVTSRQNINNRSV